MDPLLIAIIVVVLAYGAGVALLPKDMLNDNNRYTRQMLQQIERDNAYLSDSTPQTSVLKDGGGERVSPLRKIFLAMPGARAAYSMLRRVGMENSVEKYFLCMLGLFFGIVYFLRGMGALSVVLAVVGTYGLGYRYLKGREKKRRAAFMTMFPDALDVISRSVRAGYPLNTAIRIVAENLDAPVSTEFQQVADEVAYGRSFADAVAHMAERVQEPDVQFFIVVLSVQQEVGGNLAEVLGNLSGIIRKRRQLRMKIKAMTSEGRATAWILGGLPFFVAGFIHLTSPEHLLPLFYTAMGKMILAGALGMVALGVFIITRIIKVDI